MTADAPRGRGDLGRLAARNRVDRVRDRINWYTEAETSSGGQAHGWYRLEVRQGLRNPSGRGAREGPGRRTQRCERVRRRAPQSREEADQIFNGLSAGGNVEGPIGDSPWGTYAGMLRDKYGIEWIIEFDPNYEG